jgi:Spy/CpxP family protein refolding chaperone
LIAFALAPQVVLAQALQPYAGFEGRPIKALSEQQIADLRAGRGMGLALAAELNGYPGPLHVIELAKSLGLSDSQRAKMEELFTAMKAETISLGERLIAEEAALDRQFAGKTITEAGLGASMQAVGSAQAELRAAHLKYHLTTAAVLTPMQIERYTELRGYAGGALPPDRHGGHQRAH